MAARTIAKRAHIKFYEEDAELHKKLREQALKEEISLQEIIMKSCREYIKKIEANKN